MNIKALITTLAVLGSSSVAMARPTVTFSAEASLRADASWNRGPVVRDHRAPTVYSRHQQLPARYRGDLRADARWGHQRTVLLANDLRFNTGENRKFITIGEGAGQLRQLDVRAQQGRLLLKQLRIDFANGEYQIIRNIDAVLANGAVYTADLDGNGRIVTRVIVYAENLPTGWYGSSSAAFDLTAR